MTERSPEIMMPVTEDRALRQFEIEALRQITDNLKRMNDKMDRQDDKMNKLSEGQHAIDSRLVRIESNGRDGDVDELRQMMLRVKDRLAKLEEDKFRRDGAASALEWIFRNWPGVIAFLAMLLVILGVNGKLGPVG